jgi:hypothetical protein
MLLVCCFCDQARDESPDTTDLDVCAVSRMPRRQGIVVSYTCCHACLQDDPRAITFRTRRNKPHWSGATARAGARQSVAA